MSTQHRTIEDLCGTIQEDAALLQGGLATLSPKAQIQQANDILLNATKLIGLLINR